MANQSSNSSNFYLPHPSKNSAGQSKGRNGYFENLLQMIGYGFECEDNGVIDVCKDNMDDGGILCLSKSDKDSIMGVNFRGISPDAIF